MSLHYGILKRRRNNRKFSYTLNGAFCWWLLKKKMTILKDISSISKRIVPAFSVFGAIGNVLIMVYFLKLNSGKLKDMSSYHFLIIELAVIDFVVSIGTPFYIYIFYNNEWVLGEFACTVGYPFMMSICPLISCWLLVLLSYDRYRSITQPFKVRISKRIYFLASIVLFMLAFLPFIPFIQKTVVYKDDANRLQCLDGMHAFKGIHYVFYSMVFCSTDCFLPASLLYFFYRNIWRKLRDETPTAANMELEERNRVALHTLRNLIFVYVLTVFPGRLVVTSFHIYENFMTVDVSAMHVFHELFSLLSLLNNIVNIFVYTVIIKDFRLYLWKIFTFSIIRRKCGASRNKSCPENNNDQITTTTSSSRVWDRIKMGAWRIPFPISSSPVYLVLKTFWSARRVKTSHGFSLLY